MDEALAVHGHVAQLVILSVFLPGHGDVVDAPVLRGVGLFRGADPEGDGPPGAGLEGLDGLAALEVHSLAASGVRAHDAHAQGSRWKGWVCQFSTSSASTAHRVRIPMVLRFINIHLFIRYFISVPAGLLFLRAFHPQQDQVAQHQQKTNECHRQAHPNHVKIRDLIEQDTPQQKRHAEEHPLQPHHSMFDFHRDQLLFYPSAYITFERANL